MKLSVYLPAWLDHLHTPDALWTSPRQRDAFYQCLHRFSDEVTVAAYCRAGVERITESVRGEERLLGSKQRIGLNVYHRYGSGEACQTWRSVDEVWEAAEQVRDQLKREVQFDLENLTRLLDQL